MQARRTERLLNLVIALRDTRRGLRREQIRRAVPQYADCPTDAAFERMFERDKEDLREIGVPVVTVASDVLVDAEDAYRIDAGAYELPPVTFSAAEVAVLALAARAWQQAALAGPAARALTKLRAVGDSAGWAGDGDGAALRAAAGVVDVVPASVDPAFDPFHTALRAGRTVRFRYRRPDGPAAVRTVDPWRLLLRGGTWYVVGHDHDRAAPRVFRLSRVEGPVTVLRGRAARPDPRTVAAAVADAQHALGAEPRTPPAPDAEAVVEVATGRGGRLRAVALRAGSRAPDGDPVVPGGTGGPVGPSGAGSDLVRVPYASHPGPDGPEPPGWLVELVAGCGPDARVVAPPSLAVAVRRAWEAVLLRHRGPATDPTTDPTTDPATDPATDAAAGEREGAPSGPVEDAAGFVPGATDRLSRLLAMVPFVLRRDGVSLAELAAHFEVPEQQVVRDLQLLFVCGTPGHLPDDLIEADWEGGVVRIGNADAISRPLRLTGEEAVVLLLGLRRLADVPGAHDRAVVDRVTRTLEELTGGAEPVVQLVADPFGAGEHAETVATALRQGRRLRLQYLSAARDELSERVVDPVRVVVDEGRPYLQAWCHRAGGVRTFRLDRVVAALVLPEAATGHTTPAGAAGGAGPARAWATDRGGGSGEVVLRLRPGARWVAEHYPVDVLRRGDEAGSTWDVRLDTPVDRAVRLVLRLAGEAEVLAPVEAREQVAAAAAAALDRAP